MNAARRGQPDGSCTTLSLPAEGQPVDTSKPTTVVGTGTPASCTFSALDAAVKAGGIITFDCGSAPVTIPVTATLTPPTSNAYADDPPLHIVIDGGDKITLDGGGAVRIMSWVHAGSWQKNTDTLTLQHLRFVNGKTTPTQKIPPCPPSGSISNAMCSTGYDDGQGGAINMQDGNLRVIDCDFANNQAALLGPDTGGGAIYLYGTGTPSYIVESSFQNNTASNAGAVGMLWAGAFIFNSLFDGNSAVGTGANNNDATQCTCMNNGQNQIGSGGNGGAIYKDGGDGANLTICGTQIQNNSANEFGLGGVPHRRRLQREARHRRLAPDQATRARSPCGTGARGSPPTTRLHRCQSTRRSATRPAARRRAADGGGSRRPAASRWCSSPAPRPATGSTRRPRATHRLLRRPLRSRSPARRLPHPGGSERVAERRGQRARAYTAARAQTAARAPPRAPDPAPPGAAIDVEGSGECYMVGHPACPPEWRCDLHPPPMMRMRVACPDAGKAR